MVVYGLLDFTDVATAALQKIAAHVAKPRPQYVSRKPDSPSWRRHLAGQAAVHLCLRKVTAVGSIEYGDPTTGFSMRLSGAGPWKYLSISHTKSVAVVALGSVPVGIDVEECDRDVRKVLGRVCAEGVGYGFSWEFESDFRQVADTATL